MISLLNLHKTVEEALHRAQWLNKDPAEEFQGAADDLKRLGTKALLGTTPDGWRIVLVSFDISEQGFPEGTRGYDGAATKMPNFMVHLTREEAEAGFKLAMKGMN
jgi:hypothetical protein